MFNFSANHLFLLSRTEYPSYAVFLLRDLDTQRVYRLYDFTKAQLIRLAVAYCLRSFAGDTRCGADVGNRLHRRPSAGAETWKVEKISGSSGSAVPS